MNGLINSQALENFITKRVGETVNKILNENLDGKTITIDEFRKKYCGNRSAKWVRKNIFDSFTETDFDNGGWVLNPRGGRKTIIFEKKAAIWLEQNTYKIKWNKEG
ncbi:DUF771 domain-containing protein [Lactobacillus mulieris]|uniref:DUF771 domain-containing protein n=1 Tax=Lactobacillus jensenii TaxID=109790 RepID=A0ABU9FFM5_LACJE|nr:MULTISPECIES: DUF771 domain-containing protein [Lactobacillus]MCW8072797.1 DUF771 domain-containing protein [Lactobacillus mulieris]MDK6268395.1 DUF771 domain-containing protein [Lactobacillus mulieris]MDT9545028.1 DUF771 domain-containing protein [Lactobacillus jensenii]